MKMAEEIRNELELDQYKFSHLEKKGKYFFKVWIDPQDPVGYHIFLKYVTGVPLSEERMVQNKFLKK